MSPARLPRTTRRVLVELRGGDASAATVGVCLDLTDRTAANHLCRLLALGFAARLPRQTIPYCPLFRTGGLRAFVYQITPAGIAHLRGPR